MSRQSELPFDDLFTRFVDADAHWGPLLFLRPHAKQILSLPRVLALAGLLGSAFGLFGSVLLMVAARLLDRPPLALHVFPLTMFAIYFFASQLTFVPAWNRRAKRLSRA